MYEWLLFGHVLGVAVLLAGVGIYVVSVERLRQAPTVTELGLLVAAADRGERIAFIGAAPLVAAGVTMAVRFWSLSDGWIATSMGVVVAMGLAGSIVDRRMKRLRAALRSAPDEESPSTDLSMLARNPVLHASNRIYVALVVEILPRRPRCDVALGRRRRRKGADDGRGKRVLIPGPRRGLSAGRSRIADATSGFSGSRRWGGRPAFVVSWCRCAKHVLIELGNRSVLLLEVAHVAQRQGLQADAVRNAADVKSGSRLRERLTDDRPPSLRGAAPRIAQVDLVVLLATALERVPVLPDEGM